MRSNRDTKLENIMESMYTPAADVVKENDEDTGRIPHDVDSFGTGDGLDDTIEREFLEAVKALRDEGESDKEGIVNLAKDNMLTNVSMIIDEIDKNKIDSLFGEV